MSGVPVGFLHHACYDLGSGRTREQHRIAELTEGYTDVFELHARFGAPASLQLSGELLAKIARYRPQFIERTRELAENGLLSFVGGAYPEFGASETAALDVVRFQDHLDLYERELGWEPSRVTVCSVPGRAWDDRLPSVLTSPLLMNGGYRYLAIGERRGLPRAAAGDAEVPGPEVLWLRGADARILASEGSDLRDWIPRRGAYHWRPVDNLLARLGETSAASFILYSSELERTAGVAGWGVALDQYESFLRLHADHPAGTAFASLEQWFDDHVSPQPSRSENSQ
jgi:hypothetical protein